MNIGISVGSATAAVFEADTDKGASQYARMSTLGVTYVRLDASYTTGAAIWTDATVRAALAAGLNVLLIFDGYNNTTIGPTNFLAHCQRVATTYSPLGVHAYEVLNEPNGATNWDSTANVGSATGYTSLLQSIYPAIKTIDSTATIVLGSAAPYGAVGAGSLTASPYVLNPVTWLQDLYSAGAHGYFDVVGAHPYAWPEFANNPDTGNAWQQLDTTSTSLYSVMSANSDSAKKIWITEYGAPSADSPGVTSNPAPTLYPAGTLQFQAQTILQGVDLARTLPFVGGFFAFDWQDTPTGDGYFGLVNSSGTPNPSYYAFLDAVLTPTTLAQSTFGQSGTSQTFGITFSSNVTAGNLLIVNGGCFNEFLITGVTGGGTWLKAQGVALSVGGGSGSAEIWYCLHATGGATTVTITLSASPTNNYGNYLISEWAAGTGGSWTYDTSANTTNGASATAAPTPTLTPAVSFELVVACGTFKNTVSAPQAGWQEMNTSLLSTSGGYIDAAFIVDATTTSVSCPWVQGTAGQFSTVVAAFNPGIAAVAGAAPPLPAAWW